MPGDKDGSSWLTAFVVKSFSEAAQYIYVSRIAGQVINVTITVTGGSKVSPEICGLAHARTDGEWMLREKRIRTLVLSPGRGIR